MALSRDRIVTPGQTPHAHEREAFEFAVAALPDSEPYRLWAFVDLLDPSGRRYDLDLLVLGYHALYLIEVKSHPGVLTGDEVDWQFTFPDGGRSLVENPLRTTNHKARVLATLLDRQFARDAASREARRPWVQPLVFLAHPELQVKLTGAGALHVVTRETFRKALTHGLFPGAPPPLRDHPLNRPTAVATARALKALGLRPSVSALKVEGLLLRELLEDGSHFQDHLGVHQSIDGLARRVRSYLIPASTTERRDQLLRAARREAQHLTALSDHRNVLRLVDYVAEGPLGGPCVILEHLADALPLDAFLRAHPDLPFEHRLSIIQQVAEALAFCHRKTIIHRGLSPRAILVRPTTTPEGRPATPEVRLYNFQLAAHEDTLGTVHLTALTSDQAAAYLAPEVIRDPACADAVSDVFSLGAVAYFTLTGLPPGTTLAERAALMAGGHLSIAAARDDLAGGVSGRTLDDVVAFATEANPHDRCGNVIDWLNLLLDAATSPAAAPEDSFVHPLEARPRDRLSEALEVVDVLGSGSTARVLRVRRQEGGSTGEYALKVSLAPELDERLRKEGRLLASLRSERIVSLVAELTLRERTCLLLTYAGDSLASLLAQEGPPSLDFARRWGEDLLRALEALEDRGLGHRDIKPANLGVLPGEAKRKRSLLLFDFSLAGTPDTAITAGTPAYRDPFLERRGRWDAAADRWAAAMTLHELLTGIRPRWGDDDAPTAAASDEIRVVAERFDATIRSRLSGFFRQAFARDAGERFASAEEMRLAWVNCFATASYGDEDDAPAARGPDLTALSRDTPIAGLPLSARAKNALDRAGMTMLGELLQMPRNRLSTTRGIGRKTHQEILGFIDDARAALGAGAGEAQAPFFPDYRGGPAPLAQVPGLSVEAAVVLGDAGLSQLAVLASAPGAQVERLLAGHAGAIEVLRAHLSGAQAGRREAPTSVPVFLEDWIDHLLRGTGKRPKFLVTAAQLFGLEPVAGAAGGERFEDARALSRRLGVTQAAVHIAFGKARDRWREHLHIGELQAKVAAALSRLGGVAPVARVAESLLAEVPRRSGAGEAPDLAAEAVVRMAAEASGSLVLARLPRGLWLGDSQAALGLSRRLGEAADDLAVRTPLPSAEEVRAALAAVVAGTSLEALPPDRLVALAAEASAGAGRSARLELYPRGLPAARAVVLSAGALPAQPATAEGIRRIVLARYPEAEPPPERPALDELLRPLGLVWDEAKGHYVRPGLAEVTSPETRHAPRVSTTHTSHRPPPGSPGSQEAQEFDEHIRLALERRQFRVLDVPAGYDEPAAREVAHRTRARRVSLEREVLAETERLMAELGIDPAVVYQADREGVAGGEDWENLRRLMKQAAERVVGRLVAPGTALVLTQPGILARYALDDVIGRLVGEAQRDDAPPVFLVNPTDDAAPTAAIDAGGRYLPVPLLSQGQRLKVPEPWIRNLHRGGAP